MANSNDNLNAHYVNFYEDSSCNVCNILIFVK